MSIQVKELSRGVFELPDGSIGYTLDEAITQFRKTKTLSYTVNELILLLLYSYKDIHIRGRTMLFKQIFLAEREIFSEYVFDWDKVPGADTARLKEYLMDYFRNDGNIAVRKASVNDIEIGYENEYLHLSLDESKTKATLRSSESAKPKLLFFVKIFDDIVKVHAKNKEAESCDFVPYQYGPYSFLVANKVKNMIFIGLINKVREKETNVDEFMLTPRGINLIEKKYSNLPRKIKDRFQEFRKGWDQYGRKGILNDVYTNYPQFRTMSKIGYKYKLIKWGRKYV